MNKLNIKSTKLTNNDIITTSNLPCSNKYHIEVGMLNIINNEELCYLYSESNGVLTELSKAQMPTQLNGILNTYADNSHFYINIDNAAQNDIYYWSGSEWIKCNESHTFVELD